MRTFFLKVNICLTGSPGLDVYQENAQLTANPWSTQHFGTIQISWSQFINNSKGDVFLQGAATVLFMQICKRIHSRFSSGAEPSLTPGALTQSTLRKCGYRILLEICKSS